MQKMCYVNMRKKKLRSDEWIKEAVPWLERFKEGMEAPLMCEPEKYDALCTLIARVKELK